MARFTVRMKSPPWTSTLSSAQLSTYFVGVTEHLALREQAKARDGAKGRTAMNTHFPGLFEQPLVSQDAVVAAVLLDVELEVDALHGGPFGSNDPVQ